jgi:hypothetical protein
MGVIYDKFADAFRDNSNPGLPASGPHDPAKAEIRALALPIEAGIAAAALAGTDLTAAMQLVAPLLQSAQAAQGAAEQANDTLQEAFVQIPLTVADKLDEAVASATAMAEDSKDRAKASADVAQLAQAAAAVSGKLYDTTAAGLAATANGGYFLVRSSGDRFADLYRRNGTAADLQPNQLPSAQAIADKVEIDETRPVRLVTGSDNAEAWAFYVQSAAQGKQVDGVYGYHELKTGGSGYVFHGVTYSAAGTPINAGGGVGGAVGGPGGGSGVTGNRREDGPGHGGAFTRDGPGLGAAVQGSAQGAGANVQDAGRFIKQNSNGAAGGPSSPGVALAATNSSEQGEAFTSTTTENNGSLLSNLIQRLNFKTGIIARLQMLVGGARTGFFTALDVLINPGSAWTGTAPVNGINVSLNGNVQGAGQRTAINVSNAATGATASYSFAGVTSGANDTNYGGYFGATGATNNFGIYCASGTAFFAGRVQTPALPVYADNAAASVALQVGEQYRTAAGALMVRY